MAMTFERCYRIVVFEWILEGCTHQDWLWDHLVLKLEGALHRMNMGDKMNIIDDATAFLSTIWFDKLREIHEKEHWAYNDESFTASYEMHVWTTRWFPWRLVITYTWRVLFQLEASSWLIDNHDGVGTMRTINAITILRIVQRMNDRLRSSWWIKQHHTRGQSQAW
jgi:hypothetical protein